MMKISSIDQKKEKLYTNLQTYTGIAVAFSGGVDSSLLLAAARQCLGTRVIAMTAVSPLMSRVDVEEAVKIAKYLDVPHYSVETEEMENSEFAANPPNRCYICKKILFAGIRSAALEQGVRVLAHGVNVDDASDYRPGMKAAEEMGIASPLLDAGLTKEEIRILAQQVGLPNWKRPASACLASRIPYGQPITRESLSMIEAGERVLTALGFIGCRVRYCGDTARIEIRPADFSRLMIPDRRLRIIAEFRRIGFLYITMDLEGYQAGRMNRSIIPT